MSYEAFDPCTFVLEGQTRRAVRATCGRCNAVRELPFNTARRSGGDDAEILERMVSRKFEAEGWKTGSRKQLRCPKCFTEEKKEQTMSNKVISIKDEKPAKTPSMMSSASTPALDINNGPMTRDARIIITKKLESVHYGEGGGYTDDWSDEKVAAELRVPRNWVSKVREDYFGTDTNEQSTWMAEATKLVEEMKTEHAAFCKRADDLMARAITLENTIQSVKSGR